MGLSPDTRSVLLVDGNATRRARSTAALERIGYRVAAVETVDQVPSELRQSPVDALLAGLDWPAGEHGARLKRLRQAGGGAPVVLLCEPDRVRDAVRALRHGAEDYLLHPLDSHEVEARLERLFERRDLDSRLAFFQHELSKKAGFKQLEARSPAMRAALERVARVAPMRSTVLIQGESGVGKELIARSIHFDSPRRDGPFIALNCAAIPSGLIESELFGHERGSFTGAHARAKGKFEIAHLGTLFLDEIAEMDLNTQAKLLRVLEEREFMRVGGEHSIRVDVRVIAATNADLETLVAAGRFRRDLYYRLKVVIIAVPPLRERRQDVPSLVQAFLDELSRANAVRRKPILPEAMAMLQEYHWPGNVRELKNVLESVLVSVPGEVIRPEDLPPAIRQARVPTAPRELAPGMTLAEMERELIRRTLDRTGGNRTHSASLLGIGVRTLQRKIRLYELRIPPRRRRPRRRLPLRDG
ncbi:MAG TPA: sigma-54 dependent transcriptional regulator [Candidatus Polarisedimenticolaceae bacterium]|nr:sigma-54 dependent transcriptional regulator [Candidatus Polarisedimenticolaceae bacterium]